MAVLKEALDRIQGTDFFAGMLTTEDVNCSLSVVKIAPRTQGKFSGEYSVLSSICYVLFFLIPEVTEVKFVILAVD